MINKIILDEPGMIIGISANAYFLHAYVLKNLPKTLQLEKPMNIDNNYYWRLIDHSNLGVYPGIFIRNFIKYTVKPKDRACMFLSKKNILEEIGNTEKFQLSLSRKRELNIKKHYPIKRRKKCQNNRT